MFMAVKMTRYVSMFAQIVACMYMLEPCNEYPESLFSNKNKMENNSESSNFTSCKTGV